MHTSSKMLCQMPCPPTVGDPHVPFDTPGSLKPDETNHRKSYAAVKSSEAAWPKSVPLGLDPAVWPPLASMVDPPSRQYAMAKDPVPSDPPPTANKRRCQPWTRRHRKRKISTDNQPTLPPIKSDTDLTAVLSSIANDIQKQSLITLCEIHEQSIATVQKEIVLDLNNALCTTIAHLCAKICDKFSFTDTSRKNCVQIPTPNSTHPNTVHQHRRTFSYYQNTSHKAAKCAITQMKRILMKITVLRMKMVLR